MSFKDGRIDELFACLLVAAHQFSPIQPWYAVAPPEYGRTDKTEGERMRARVDSARLEIAVGPALQLFTTFTTKTPDNPRLYSAVSYVQEWLQKSSTQSKTQHTPPQAAMRMCHPSRRLESVALHQNYRPANHSKETQNPCAGAAVQRVKRVFDGHKNWIEHCRLELFHGAAKMDCLFGPTTVRKRVGVTCF